MRSPTTYYTDLQLIDEYCEKYLEHTSPPIFREMESRGLLAFVNYLPNDSDEAKAVVRTRLSQVNRYFKDEEIDQVAEEIHRMTELRKQIDTIEITEVHQLAPLLDEMQFICNWLLDYFKPPRIIQ